MAARNSATQVPAERELTITRVFDAPPGLVFKVWTQPEHLVRWWGPRDFTTPSCKMDIRPGGTYRICIKSPEGKDHWMTGIYREVAAPTRLVFTFAWEEDGKPGFETLVTVTFADQAGKTKLTFHQAMFESANSRDSHHEGWSECFLRLESYLAKI